MSIRLVNDVGEVFWFTSGNLRTVLTFASLHGWPPKPLLEPSKWDESLTWNDQYEIVGGASLTKKDALALADAIDRGINEDPVGSCITRELEIHADDVRQKLPEYEPARHAVDLLKEWSRFREFARSGALRVDLTD